MAPEKIEYLRQRLKEGAFVNEVARELGITGPGLRNHARPIIAELTEAGFRCGCGRELGHNLMCKEKMARRTRGASPDRGDRQVAAKPRVMAGAKAPHVADRAVYHEALKRYRAGASARRIATDTGLSRATVKRLVNHWRSRSRIDPKPCVCGRPARHPGGCIKNTPGSLNWRWIARIEDMILAGKTVSQVAAQLRISLMTALTHAAPARAKLQASGVTCPCGRPYGHRGLCSATWDRFDLPRGPWEVEMATKRRIARALINGDTAAAIAAREGFGEDTIWHLRKELPQRDLERRRRVMRQRLAMTDDAYSKMVLQRIQHIVRARTLDPSGEQSGRDFARTLEDIRNDLYLAVMEGRIEIEQVELAARRMLAGDRIEREHAPPSADAPTGMSGASRADRLEDTTAVEHLDDLMIGRGGDNGELQYGRA